MHKVGISLVTLQATYGDKRAIEIASEIGADTIDLNLDPQDYRNVNSVYSKGDDYVFDYYEKLGEYARSLGLEVSQTHGQVTGFKNIKDEDDALVENIRLDLLATGALKSPVCVVHNATSIHLGPTPDPQLMYKLSYDMFSRTIPYAKRYGVKIATETFGDAVRFNACDFFGNIAEFKKVYSDIKSLDEFKDHFTICVDTGHSNKAMRYNNPTPADVIRELGSEVTVLHLNDNDTLTDQHKIPMTGVIDWNDVFNALDEIGYSGVYNMELALDFFGKDFQIQTAEFAVKLLKHYILKRYGN